MIWIIFTIIILILFFVFFIILSGENERIKVFLRIYKKAKTNFPNTDEREILGIVIEEFILPGKAIKLGKSGIKGIDYLNNIFDNKEITINDIIFHAITLEFPQKYKSLGFDLSEIRKINRDEKIDLRQQLRDKIELYKNNLFKA